MVDRESKLVFLFLIFGLFLSACAVPQTDQQTPTNIPAAVTSAPANTSEPSPTPTPLYLKDWVGSWYVWVEDDIHRIPAELKIEGNQLTAKLDREGEVRTIVADFLPDGISAAGSWSSTDENSGSLDMLISEDRQEFSGNMGGELLFCGSRIGQKKPNPCMAKLGPDWSGEWIAWLGPDEVELVLFFKVSEGTVTVMGYDVEGTVSPDGRTFSGTFNELGIQGGSINAMILDNMAQFTGNIMGIFPFCGVRRGGPKPEVCMGR